MVQVHEQPESIRFYIGANVEVAPDVAIAAGAVLEAAPDASLIVASGACIGAGVIVQATGGKLVLGAGVNLGGGVLIVGQGIVGPHACIGADSTLLNPQVEAGAVIPARSLLTVSSVQINGVSSPPPETSTPNTVETEVTANNGKGGNTSPTGVATTATEPEPSAPPAPMRIVYGREQVEQLMKTLFPHRDSLNGQNGTS